MKGLFLTPPAVYGPICLSETFSLSSSSCSTKMSLLLGSTPVSAATCLGLPVNLLSRKCSWIHGVDDAVQTVDLPVNVLVLGQALTVSFSFVVVDADFGFEIAFGGQWESWCTCNKGQSLVKHGLCFVLIGHILVSCPLPVIDISPDIYHDVSSTDVFRDIPSSSHQSYDHPSSFSSIDIIDSQSQSGHSILHDMFFSQRVTGIRASIFRCSEVHLRKLCSLHGLDISCPSNVRHLKLRLLYHIINGDCFAQRCEQSSPLPDHLACLCVAGTFPSAMSITSFVVGILKDSSPAQLSTEHLLLIVESLGDQSRYEQRSHLCRRVFKSLETFLTHCRQ